jgi:hypothetical protein
MPPATGVEAFVRCVPENMAPRNKAASQTAVFGQARIAGR